MTSANRSQRYILIAIAAFFLISGGLRIGSSGFAMARSEPASAPNASINDPRTDIDLVAKLLDEAEARMRQLEAREQNVLDQESALELARQVIEQKLVQLEEAETRLATTIAQVDGASERDLDQLTKMYSAMKPKIAADLFEQMEAEFAAGFLGRMQSDSAGAIMSGLTPQKAYAISVYLAGRNANAPTE